MSYDVCPLCGGRMLGRGYENGAQCDTCGLIYNGLGKYDCSEMDNPEEAEEELNQLNNQGTYKEDKAEESNKKYYFVSQSAEGTSTGYVHLTPEEAQIVEYATNSNNWEKSSLQQWSGSFFIDVDNPVDNIREE